MKRTLLIILAALLLQLPAVAQDGVGGIEFIPVPAILILPNGQAQRVLLLVAVRPPPPTMTVLPRAGSGTWKRPSKTQELLDAGKPVSAIQVDEVM